MRFNVANEIFEKLDSFQISRYYVLNDKVRSIGMAEVKKK